MGTGMPTATATDAASATTTVKGTGMGTAKGKFTCTWMVREPRGGDDA